MVWVGFILANNEFRYNDVCAIDVIWYGIGPNLGGINLGLHNFGEREGGLGGLIVGAEREPKSAKF